VVKKGSPKAGPGLIIRRSVRILVQQVSAIKSQNADLKPETQGEQQEDCQCRSINQATSLFQAEPTT
jgi:hypothetical protein